MDEWQQDGGELGKHALLHSERTLEAYRTQPELIREHVGIEEHVFSSGYGRRQIFELVQNAADAIVHKSGGGKVSVVLTDDALYCANEGAPIDEEGVTAILGAYLSKKRGAQIGHFGLGFKSVLNVSSTPQFFCRGGSFGFDRELSAKQITTIRSDLERVPVLRLAQLLNPIKEASTDSILAELMTWATTVVRLPRNLGDSSWLSEELAGFPPHFLIFSPHVRQLELVDQANDRTRKIEVSADDGIVTIGEASDRSAWAIFKRDIPTGSLAKSELDDAEPSTQKRESLPLIWAVPFERERARGRFWAFFPTETETTLSGILNAPWKTNADRQNLLRGPFNDRLLDEFISMVRTAWPELLDPEDPGALLDLLPARQADEKNWADGHLSKGVYDALSTAPAIPNSAGHLILANAAKLRPDESTTEGGRSWIQDNPGAEFDPELEWVHSTVESRERRPRAERLGCSKAKLSQWLFAIAASKTVSASKRALSLVDAFLPSSSSSATLEEVSKTPFVLSTRLELVSPNPQQLFLPTKSNADPPVGIQLVHRSVAGDPAALSALKRLQIRELGIGIQAEQLLRDPDPDWAAIWGLLRKLTRDEAERFVRINGHQMRVKTLTGQFSRLLECLLPGPIGDPSIDADHELLVDLEFHKADKSLLETAGVVSTPQPGFDVTQESWFDGYLSAVRTSYRKAEPRAHQIDCITPEAPIRSIGPLHALTRGSVVLKSRLTSHLLDRLDSNARVTFYYSSRPKAYPHLQFAEPAIWCIRQFGLVPTSLGFREAKESLDPALTRWSRFLPIAKVSAEIGAGLSLRKQLAGVPASQWLEAFQEATLSTHLKECEEAWELYAESCPYSSRPDELVVYMKGRRSIVDCEQPTYVTDDKERFSVLHEAGLPTVLVSGRGALEALTEKWKLIEGVATAHYEPCGEAAPLLDMLPGLQEYVSSAIADSILLQPCAALWVEVDGADGFQRSEVSFARQGSTLCYRDHLSLDNVFDLACGALDVRLNPMQREAALSLRARAQRQELIAKVREQPTIPKKLMVLVGTVSIARQLPRKVIDAAIVAAPGRPEDEVVAEAAFAVFGVELLKRYTAELIEAGANPPRAWNGGRAALEFCEEFAFPPEFSGFPRIGRDPMLEVDGPIELKPLHDFQTIIAERIQRFFLKSKPLRGLLSLPTGAGKTRVVVEALIRGLKELPSPTLLIWIAQTDELCEQAVQAWSQAWRALGPSMRLRVSRLWGSTNNRVRSTGDSHVVVTTYQSLGSRLSWPEYQWLKATRCVVIDEAHGSTAPSYTEILQQFGLTSRETDRHLLGLTATPFRGSGMDENETRWLANRYGQSRFDQDAMPDEDPYVFLQRQGVLASVEHKVLQGLEIQLSQQEQAHLTQYNELPPSAEQRLGDDDFRNQSLVSTIEDLDPTWPILLFATSVAHSRLMAALLSLRGISAHSITGDMDVGARRHYINQFKEGKLRVLTNYGVLTTGFDAPAIRALIIARPVYSRALYQQMIGRGLRGPKNGGKERCLIINVKDNVAQFGTKLAFRDFEHLWQPWTG